MAAVPEPEPEPKPLCNTVDGESILVTPKMIFGCQVFYKDTERSDIMPTQLQVAEEAQGAVYDMCPTHGRHAD